MIMKQITKTLTIAGILLLTITASKAQEVAKVKTNDWRLGVGINLGTTLGDFDKTYGLTLGGDLKLQRDITESLSGTLTTGYTNFFAKKDFKDFGGKDFGIVPLKAGLKVFPTKGFYISAEVGAGFGVQEGAGTGFLYSPGIGVAFAKDFDISARYEAVSFKNDVTLGQVALRFAYAFSL